MSKWDADIGGNSVQTTENLNDLRIVDADGPDEPLRGRRPSAVTSGNVTAIFQDIAGRLITEIQRCPVVLGCVAWLTNSAIIRALSTRKIVQIIVQKEDFLRPDSDAEWTPEHLHALYDTLPYTVTKNDLTFTYNYCGDWNMAPVRCAGLNNSDGLPAFPRMHHKFLVFADLDEHALEQGEDVDPLNPVRPWIVPRRVWTGSFNLTYNGTNSLENALLIDDEVIARAYTKEWHALLGVSEPLNWDDEWVRPEFRIGT